MNHSTAGHRHWGALALLLAITGLAAFVGAAASFQAADFYLKLNLPSWAPPAQVFGPVWSVLYLMMAVAAWLVVRAAGWPAARGAITLYLVQLAFNALWSWLFFRWHWGAGAMTEVLILWLALLLATRAFWRTTRAAGALLFPYVAWVTFAAGLTYAVWQRNPGTL